MMCFDDKFDMTAVAAQMTLRASRNVVSVMDQDNLPVIREHMGYHAQTGTLLVFTRDTGHSRAKILTSPIYARCYHLSMSFREVEEFGNKAPFNPAMADQWLDAFFPNTKGQLWIQVPDEDFKNWHFMLFYSHAWRSTLFQCEADIAQAKAETGWISHREFHQKFVGGKEGA